MSTRPSKNASPALELLDISRRFGETQALAGASLTIRRGEIHALLGENGAGKSTLVSIAAGVLDADGGQVLLGGREVRFPSPREARRAGLALVPQHDLLVEAFTVAENLALLDPSAPFFESPGGRRARVRRLAEDSALDPGPPRVRVEDLPVGARQRIEIAGALAGDPEVLILDEPTAVLAPGEAAALFGSLRRRAADGKAVVLITHRLAEVFEAADRLTLLARGKTVRTCLISETTPDEIGALLLAGARGFEAERQRVERPREGFLRGGGSPVLTLSEVVPSGSSAPPVSLSLYESDLLVLLAIDGNGADTLARCIAGMHPFTGHIELLGGPLPRRGEPRAFREAGGRFIPADRRAEGVVATFSLEENLALPSPPGRFLLDRPAMRRRALERLSRFGIRAASPLAKASGLSGGNQQKLVLARELDFREGPPPLLVAIHPTRGLDLAASEEIRFRIDEAREAGAAVLVVGSDPEEARPFGGTFRVVYRGALSEPLQPDTPLPALGRRMAGLAA